jgi:hypothetical protein
MIWTEIRKPLSRAALRAPVSAGTVKAKSCGETRISNQRNTMPETISKTENLQIIAGAFSDREQADKAMVGRGFAESQAAFYDKAIREGKTLVAVHNVTDPKPVIDVFDKFGSDFNPNGTRNVRQDVFGMTAGAAIGATALGTAGAVVAGPLGAAAGVAAGTVVGGALGAAAGKAVEHDK